MLAGTDNATSMRELVHELSPGERELVPTMRSSIAHISFRISSLEAYPDGRISFLANFY
jgi:hypothetical protein